MAWDLFDVETGFYFDRFDTRDDALQFVRSLLNNNGDDYANVLELGSTDDLKGASNLTGDALVTASRSLVSVPK